MIRHEGSDPRRPDREAEERRRQARISAMLILAIAGLSGAVFTLMVIQGRSPFG